MVKMGDADAFISGLTYDYPDVIRPALQIHHTAAGAARAAGVYIMIFDEKVFLFTDPTVTLTHLWKIWQRSLHSLQIMQ